MTNHLPRSPPASRFLFSLPHIHRGARSFSPISPRGPRRRSKRAGRRSNRVVHTFIYPDEMMKDGEKSREKTFSCLFDLRLFAPSAAFCPRSSVALYTVRPVRVLYFLRSFFISMREATGFVHMLSAVNCFVQSLLFLRPKIGLAPASSSHFIFSPVSFILEWVAVGIPRNMISHSHS